MLPAEICVAVGGSTTPPVGSSIDEEDSLEEVSPHASCYKFCYEIFNCYVTFFEFLAELLDLQEDVQYLLHMNQEVLTRLLHHLQNSFLPPPPSFMQYTQVRPQQSYSYQQATASVNVGSHAVGMVCTG
jgi:hypothetical protein